MIGAVVVFDESVPREQAERVLRDLAWRKIIKPTTAHEFDPEDGAPVWYVP